MAQEFEGNATGTEWLDTGLLLQAPITVQNLDNDDILLVRAGPDGGVIPATSKSGCLVAPLQSKTVKSAVITDTLHVRSLTQNRDARFYAIVEPIEALGGGGADPQTAINTGGISQNASDIADLDGELYDPGGFDDRVTALENATPGGGGVDFTPFSMLLVSDGHAGTALDPFEWIAEFTVPDESGVYFPDQGDDGGILFQNGIYECTINFVGLSGPGANAGFLVNVPDQRRTKQLVVERTFPGGASEIVAHQGLTVQIDARYANNFVRELVIGPANGSQAELAQIELHIKRLPGTGDAAYTYATPANHSTGGTSPGGVG